MRIARHGNTRYWIVYASDGALICLTVCRKGTAEIVRRLQQALEAAQQWQDINGPRQEGVGSRGSLQVVATAI